MVCIYCGNSTKVTNSRPQISYHSIWRRRSCLKCEAVLTTLEKYDLGNAFLVKKRSGALESFNRDKLMLSVAKAIDHKKNPSQAAIDLTENVLKNMFKSKPVAKIITSSDISNMASLALKRYDPTSAIKYLAVQSPGLSRKQVKDMLS